MSEPVLHFTDAAALTLHGKPFADTPRRYGRLPTRAEGVVPDPVWGLSQMAAGLFIDIETDASEVHIEIERDISHITDAGKLASRDQALDAYRWDGTRWGWVGIQRDLAEPTSRFCLAKGLPAGNNRLRLYLGYSARVERLAIGVPEGCLLRDGTRDEPKPILFYGTSIIHGYHANRAGMTLPSLLSRRLGRTVWNQGFSGNARMELALAELHASVDPAVYVVDCLPNMNADLVRERAATYVKTLRAAHPQTPILLIENIVYQATYQLADERGGWGPKNDALREVYHGLLRDSVSGLFYVPGDNLLGTDGEGTTDGTHPNDVGYARMADAIEPILRSALASIRQ
jgi:hypothetical protein